MYVRLLDSRFRGNDLLIVMLTPASARAGVGGHPVSWLHAVHSHDIRSSPFTLCPFHAVHHKQRRISKSTLQRSRQATAAKLAEAEQQLQHVESEINIQQRALQQEQDLARTARVSSHMRAIYAEIGQLERQRGVLEQQVQTLASINARLAV